MRLIWLFLSCFLYFLFSCLRFHIKMIDVCFVVVFFFLIFIIIIGKTTIWLDNNEGFITITESILRDRELSPPYNAMGELLK